MKFGALVILTISLLTAPAFAGGLEPMIELGGGTETVRGGGTLVLLRVNFGMRKSYGTSEPGDIVNPEQFIIARITGDVAVTKNADGTATTPYMNIDFIPFSDQVGVGNAFGNAIIGDFQLLPTHIHRDIEIDQNYAVSIAVVGVKFEFYRELNDSLLLYTKIAVDLLGYRMVNRISDADKFSGFHIGKADVAVGLDMKITDGFRVRLSAGAEADANWGAGGRTEGMTSPYAELRASIRDTFELFIRGAIDREYDSKVGGERDYRLTSGLSIIF